MSKTLTFTICVLLMVASFVFNYLVVSTLESNFNFIEWQPGLFRFSLLVSWISGILGISVFLWLKQRTLK